MKKLLVLVALIGACSAVTAAGASADRTQHA